MIRILLMTSCLLLVSASPVTFDQSDSVWQSFKSVHKRTYTGELETLRKQIFTDNLNRITQHNAEADMGLHTYWQGVNQFTDLTNAEFRQRNMLKISKKQQSGSAFLVPENLGELPAKVDWRKKGYVTPVKNQAQCGSCWAFSATGSLEGQHFKKTGRLVSLSEQNLVDCSTAEGNQGCNGGFMDQAYEYIKKNGGIDTEKCYPYEAEDGQCRFKTACIGATCTGYTDIAHKNETALQVAVATVGPIAIAIDAGHQSFQSYSHGVYNEPDCSQDQLDHGVLAAGYGFQFGANGVRTDYWLVKNSWAESWGIHGYIHMSRNKNNQCGVASMASYPLV